MSAALRELRAGTPVVYLYWSEIDHSGHAHGVASDAWIGQVEQFDAGLAMLMRGLPSGVRAVLTADHGMINVEPDRIIDVASTPALREGVRIVAGETRAAHVHAEEGRADEVEERWRETLGGERLGAVARPDARAHRRGQRRIGYRRPACSCARARGSGRFADTERGGHRDAGHSWLGDAD